MAIDANVLINERVREELRAGNSPQASITAAKREFAGGGEWTDKVWALDTKVYRTDPLV